MQTVTKEQFFKAINPKDVVTSCNYHQGDKQLETLFKTRYGVLVGKIVQPLPAIDTLATSYHLEV
jgi:hypothetical protein